MTPPGRWHIQPGTEHDWRATRETPVPGKTMGPLAVVERDYGAIADKWAALGPLVDKLGLTTKGVTTHPDVEVAELGAKFGLWNSGAAEGRPAITTAEHMADVILALSGTSNGRLAVEGFRELERRTGRRLVHLAEGSEERRITYADTQARPVPVITSPEWSGSETGGRRYAPVHGEHRGAQALSHADRTHAFLCRPRLARGTRRAAAHLPAAAGHVPVVRRARRWVPRGSG